MPTITIEKRIVGAGYPAFIIAEAGINHQGNVEIAKKLIEEAHTCGADAIKFQKRTINRVLTRDGLDAPYDNYHSFGKTYGEHRAQLELSHDAYRELFSYAKSKGILFCASSWDEESADFLDELGIAFFKMASADLTNFPLLLHVAKKGRPVVLSTGMADMKMVRAAYELVRAHNSQTGILQCTTTYPSAFNEINLNILKTYRNEFPDAVIGYSGHEQGIAIPPVAVALGASIIERHFTLDRAMKGRDHAASLEPQGLAKMIRDIRHVEEAMGSHEKQCLDSERDMFRKLTKSLVAAVDIKNGARLTREMITTKGPGFGISPTRIEEVIGRNAARDIGADSILMEDDIAWN